MNFHNRIERNPEIMMGKPCIKGTRLTVQLILESLAYQSKDELLRAYPNLKDEDIQAAMLFAAAEVGPKMIIDPVAH